MGNDIFDNWPGLLVTLVNYLIAFVFGLLNDLIAPFLPES